LVAAALAVEEVKLAQAAEAVVAASCRLRGCLITSAIASPSSLALVVLLTTAGR